MIPHGFKQALVTYVDTFGPGALQAVKDEVETLFALINQRRGKELVSSSVNGKTFGYTVQMTVEEKFAVYAEAYRECTGNRIVCTYPDFSGLVR